MVAVLLHGLQHSSEEGLVLQPKASAQEVKNGYVGWLEIADIGVEFLIHVLEDAAILEGKTADLLDVFAMLLLEHQVCDSERLEEDDGLSVQKASLVLIPVENVKVFLG